MPITDDLSSLFAPSPQGMGAPTKVVQGVVLSFSQVDGSNTVGVGPSTLTNVPMLLTGAEVNYKIGDPILLLVVGNTFMIMGKVAGVGSTQFASASFASHNYTQLWVGAYLGAAIGTFATGVTATITVPVWANTMTFYGCVECSYQNASTTVDADIQVQHTMNGSGSGALDGYVPLGNHQFTSAPKFQSGVQTVSPGSTITATGQLYSTIALTNLSMLISGVCIFTKS
jgi:hypothetical protein